MKPEIVFIHGMWGGGGVWDRFRAFFEARGYVCRAPDLRFHEACFRSAPPPELGRTGLLDYAGDLAKLLEGADPKPVLVGHSMGGLLAQMLAGRGLAGAVVLLSPAPMAGTVFLNPVMVWCFRNIIAKWGFWRKPARLSYRDAVFALFNKMDENRRRALFADCGYESGRAIFEIGLSFLDRRRAARVDVEKVRCPVLVVVGKEDRITPASVVRRTAKRYGGRADYRELDGRAHWLPGEPGWEDLAADIEGWLAERRVTS